MAAVQMVHFSDVLCVWAYIAQIRMDELEKEFGAELAVQYRFISVFGSAREKLERRWASEGGMAAYSAHVQRVAGEFTHVSVHPEVWTGVAPRSSWPAHLFLCAIRLLEKKGVVAPGSQRAITWAVRKGFFEDLVDVSNHDALLALGERLGVSPGAVVEQLRCGAAHAELSGDLDLARDQDTRVSPSLTLNEGRQRLNGNVGYRVIAANVREILERPQEMKSWC